METELALVEKGFLVETSSLLGFRPSWWWEDLWTDPPKPCLLKALGASYLLNVSFPSWTFYATLEGVAFPQQLTDPLWLSEAGSHSVGVSLCTFC